MLSIFSHELIESDYDAKVIYRLLRSTRRPWHAMTIHIFDRVYTFTLQSLQCAPEYCPGYHQSIALQPYFSCNFVRRIIVILCMELISSGRVVQEQMPWLQSLHASLAKHTSVGIVRSTRRLFVANLCEIVEEVKMRRYALIA